MQTNTYQAAIVTDNIYTYLFFTYSCGQMEWSTARSGRHAAVVGYNSGPLKRFNHPASGLDFIVEAVSCIARENSEKGVTASPFEVTPQSLGNDPFQGGTQLTTTAELDIDYRICIIFANSDSVTEIREAHKKISPCPSTKTQAQEDHRFLVMNQNESNCYVWAFAIEKGDDLGSRRTYTKQCCYDHK